jgi:hypothetical protein
MKRVEDLEQSIRELPVSVDPAMDDRILGRAKTAMTQAPPADADKPQIRSKGILLIKRNWSRFAAAAAIILAALVVYNVLQPRDHPAGAAFADVLASAARARTVCYREVMRTSGEPEFIYEEMLMEPGHRRCKIVETWYGKERFLIQDRNRGIALWLSPSAKKAYVDQAVNVSEKGRHTNHVEWMRRLHQDSGRFVGQETLDGRLTSVFVVEKPFERTTIWTDVATNLAVRTETHTWPNPKYGVAPPSMTIHHQYFGGSSSDSTGVKAGGGEGIQAETTTVRSHFVWDAQLDPSLFDVVPPPGYQVEHGQSDVGHASHEDLVASLRFWAETSDGGLPDTVRTMLKAEPKIAKRFRNQPEPLNEARRMAKVICNGVFFAENLKVQDNFHYAGRGAKIGQANSPICWWQLEDGKTCRVVYGDLAIRDVPADELAGVPESPAVEPAPRTVRYQETFILNGNVGGAAHATHLLMEPGYHRTERGGPDPSSVLIMDFGAGIQLDLLTKKKVAYLHDYNQPPGQASQPASRPSSRGRRSDCHNPLEELTMRYLRGGLRGQETLDGRTVEVYEYEDAERHERGTVWLDPATELPVRVEKVEVVPADHGASGAMAGSDGATGSRASQEEHRTILTDFEWDVPLDPSLFSIEVPEGYTVQVK